VRNPTFVPPSLVLAAPRAAVIAIPTDWLNRRLSTRQATLLCGGSHCHGTEKRQPQQNDAHSLFSLKKGSAAEKEEPAVVGGNTVTRTRAGTKDVTHFIVASTEAVS
jgi:hypothetical protein